MSKPEFLSKIAISINLVGSRFTVDPPPMDTDEDWLVLIPEKHFKDGVALDLLAQNGFQLDNQSERYRADESLFNSWRHWKDDTNILITANRDFNNRFLAATSLAKRYNLKTRPERVDLFQSVLYGAILDREQFDQEKPVSGTFVMPFADDDDLPY